MVRWPQDFAVYRESARPANHDSSNLPGEQLVYLLPILVPLAESCPRLCPPDFARSISNNSAALRRTLGWRALKGRRLRHIKGQLGDSSWGRTKQSLNEDGRCTINR